MPTLREQLAACAIGQNIYVFGGDLNENDSGQDANERYDVLTDSWTIMQDMPGARYSLTASAVDGKCYVIGGRAGFTVVDKVEVYDPQSNQWATRNPMPTKRFFHAAGVIDGIIYVVGGTPNASSVLSTLEAYNPASDTWTTLSPMPTKRAAAGVAVVNGKLYVMGGTHSPEVQAFSVVEVYDPTTDTWSSVANLPTDKAGLAASVVENHIYTMGGGRTSASSSVEKYDPLTDQWSISTPFDQPRTRLASASVGGTIYTFGGSRFHSPPHPGLNIVESLTPSTGVFNFEIGHIGSWWKGPERSGEGLQLEISADGGDGLIMVATFYSYDTAGNQIFMIAVGEVDGDTAEVDVFITEDGVWGDAFDPGLVNETQWGTGTLTSRSCALISMELRPNAIYQALGYHDLMYDLIRLTTPLIPCPYFESVTSSEYLGSE